MDAYEVLAYATILSMLPLLATGLFVAYKHKRDFMRRSGFGKPEVGMLLVGSLFGIFTDIPVIIYGDALLNVNLGGALIPVIVAGSLIYQKKLDIIKLSLGVISVSVISYYLTRFEPGVGIIAVFPYYLVPSAAAILIAVIFESEGSKRIPYAYSTAVLGVLIGADLVRIPLLIDESVMGSIGGAGAMDLVYLSGLIAALPLVAFYYFKNPLSRAKEPLDESLRMLRSERYGESIELSLISVRWELRKAYRLICDPFRQSYDPDRYPWFTFRALGIHPLVAEDYNRMYQAKTSPDRYSAHKAFFTASMMVDTLAKAVNKQFMSLSRRIVAYIIDMILVTLPIFLLLVYYVLSRPVVGEDPTGMSPVFFALASLLISAQFIYFTIVEWYFGTTVGKRLMGLKVVSDDFQKISFVQSAARNSGRYADIALFYYLFSLVLISSSPKGKRIGDHMGGTMVVKYK